jgi:hypothetical protein
MAPPAEDGAPETLKDSLPTLPSEACADGSSLTATSPGRALNRPPFQPEAWA